MRRMISCRDFSGCNYSDEEIRQVQKKLEDTCLRMMRCCHLPMAYYQELETYLCNICYRILLSNKKLKNLDSYCFIAVKHSIYHFLKSKKDWNKKNIELI